MLTPFMSSPVGFSDAPTEWTQRNIHGRPPEPGRMARRTKMSDQMSHFPGLALLNLLLVDFWKYNPTISAGPQPSDDRKPRRREVIGETLELCPIAQVPISKCPWEGWCNQAKHDSSLGRRAGFTLLSPKVCIVD